MPLSLSNFAAWQQKCAELANVRQWLDHIGKRGRESDILNLSPGHCSPPKFTLSGQYTTGGQNYWESPNTFDVAMKAVIIRRFKELSEEAVALIEKEVAAYLVAAESEMDAVQTALTEAKSLSAA